MLTLDIQICSKPPVHDFAQRSKMIRWTCLGGHSRTEVKTRKWGAKLLYKVTLQVLYWLKYIQMPGNVLAKNALSSVTLFTLTDYQLTQSHALNTPLLSLSCDTTIKITWRTILCDVFEHEHKKVMAKYTLAFTQGMHVPAMNTPCIGPIMEPDTLRVTWMILPNLPAKIPRKIPDSPAKAAATKLNGECC